MLNKNGVDLRKFISPSDWESTLKYLNSEPLCASAKSPESYFLRAGKKKREQKKKRNDRRLKPRLLFSFLRRQSSNFSSLSIKRLCAEPIKARRQFKKTCHKRRQKVLFFWCAGLPARPSPCVILSLRGRRRGGRVTHVVKRQRRHTLFTPQQQQQQQQRHGARR